MTRVWWQKKLIIHQYSFLSLFLIVDAPFPPSPPRAYDEIKNVFPSFPANSSYVTQVLTRIEVSCKISEKCPWKAITHLSIFLPVIWCDRPWAVILSHDGDATCWGWQNCKIEGTWVPNGYSSDYLCSCEGNKLLTHLSHRYFEFSHS